jgi:hypothetical protein
VTEWAYNNANRSCPIDDSLRLRLVQDERSAYRTFAAYHMLAKGIAERDLGETYLDQIHQTRTVANLKRRIGRFGYQVSLEPKAQAAWRNPSPGYFRGRDSRFGQRIVHALTVEVLDGWPCGIADPLVRPSEPA